MVAAPRKAARRRIVGNGAWCLCGAL